MLRFGFLAKKLSRSFLEITTKDIGEKSLIDIKFSISKDLNSFLCNIDVPKYSLQMLTYMLKISKENPQKLDLKSLNKLNQIKYEIEQNLDKLDSQAIINFSEWVGKSDSTNLKESISLEKKELLSSRINKLLSTHSFDRKQILTIYENLAPQGYKLEEVENEVQKIVDNPSTLTLKEISQIIAGNGRLIYTRRVYIFYSCMDRIFQLQNQEELDGELLAKILNVLTLKAEKTILKRYLEKFIQTISVTIPRWKENDLLSIIKFYKNNDDIHRDVFYCALDEINSRLSNELPIEFIIQLLLLLNEKIGLNTVTKEIHLKSLKIIDSKLSEGFVGEENLSNILDIIKPIADYRTVNLLRHQIYTKSTTYFWKLEMLQKASWILVNNEGKLFSLTDLIPIKIEYKWYENYSIEFKLDSLYCISNTKNYKLYGLQKIKNQFIDDLDAWLTLDNKNAKILCHFLRYKGFISKLAKNLKPLQAAVYSSIRKESMSRSSLLDSMLFYESDPKAWEYFLIENKNSFSFEQILKAIRFYKGPFVAIIYLLEVYKNSLSATLLAAAMKKITEIQDTEVLNRFACILNKLDPHHLLFKEINDRIDCFNHLFIYSDFSLLTDLFVGVQKILKDSPIDTLFSNNNIKILSYAAFHGSLDSELADQIISNYGFMKYTDRLSLLIISSKCTDEKLRESFIKTIFNDKLISGDVRTALERYSHHPKNKEIDSYIIEVLNKILPNIWIDAIFYMTFLLSKFLKVGISNHLELFNGMLAITESLLLKNIRLLRYIELTNMLILAEKKLLNDFDFADVIWRSQQANRYENNDKALESLIEKIKTVGLPDKKAVLTICNKKDNFSSAYLASTISCFADLRLDEDEEIKDIAKNLINYSENKKLVFKNDTEYINWIYGLISFNANKSVIMRHLENSKYFDIENPIFKHFLLANHFSLDPNYKGMSILEQKTEQYWRDFDYFKHFGIDKPLIGHINALFDKANLEVKSGKFIDGIWVPFYIPSRKAALWPITSSILLYNTSKLRGEFLMHQKQMLNKLKDLIILDIEQTNQIEKLDIGQFLKK